MNRNRRLARYVAYTLAGLIIGTAPITVPLLRKAHLRTQESQLKNEFFTLRTVIDEYTFDKKMAPRSLDDLVREGYLKAVPVDPITGAAIRIGDVR
jgi:general secretion pathway protein G